MTVRMPGTGVYFQSSQSNVSIASRPPDSAANATAEKLTYNGWRGSFIPDVGGIWTLSDGQQIHVAEKLEHKLDPGAKLVLYVQDEAVLLIGVATYGFTPDKTGSYLFNGLPQPMRATIGVPATFTVASSHWGANVPDATVPCTSKPTGSTIASAALASNAMTSPTVAAGTSATLAQKMALQDSALLAAVAALGGGDATAVKAAMATSGSIPTAWAAALADTTPTVANEDPVAAELIVSGGFTKATK